MLTISKPNRQGEGAKASPKKGTVKWDWDKIKSTLDENFLSIFHYYYGTASYRGTPRLNKPAKIQCIIVGTEDRIHSGAVYADHYHSFSAGKTLYALQLVEFAERCDLASAVKRAFEIIGQSIPCEVGSEDYQGYVPRPRPNRNDNDCLPTEVIDEAAFTTEKRRRDTEYQKIPGGLSEFAQADLLSRGLSLKDIKTGQFKAVQQYQEIPGCKFPGISSSKVVSRSGYTVPIFDEEGLVIGCQVKCQDGDAKYVMLGRADDAKFDFGEYPVSIIPSVTNPEKLHLTEGILKPFVCASLAPECSWMGAVSSNWTNGMKQLKLFVESRNIKTIVIMPDAGMMKNLMLAKRYRKQALEIAEATSCEVKFGHWGQLFDKSSGLDPDEYLQNAVGNQIPNPMDKVQEISVSEWDILLASAADGSDKKLVNDYKAKTALGEWQKTFEFSPDLTVSSRFLDGTDPKLKPANKGEILAIKSPLGTGKTELLKQWTETLWSHQGIVALGPLNSLLKQTAYRCGWTHSWSQQGKGFSRLLEPKGKVAMCVHSLHRGDVTNYLGKHIILDEWTQTLDALLHDPGLRSSRHELLRKFRWVLRLASSVTVMDGNLTDFSVAFLQNLSGFKVRKVENNWKKSEGKVRIISGSPSLKSGKDYSKLIDGILGDLLAGKKVAVASDSQKECEALDKILAELGYNGLRIDSKTSGEPLQQQFLADPDTFLNCDGDTKRLERMKQLSLLEEGNTKRNDRSCQYVIYSPTAQSGLSISSPYFDRFYGVFKGVLSSPEIHQMLYRVRNVPERIVYVPQNMMHREFLWRESRENTVKNLSAIAFEEINSLGLLDAREIKRVFSENLNSIDCQTSWHYQSRLSYESSHLRDCLIRILEDTGIDVSLDSELGDKEILAEIAETKEEIEAEESEKILECELIDEAEYRQLKANPSSKVEDRRKVYKYSLSQSLPGCVEHPDFSADFITWYGKNRGAIAAAKLHYQMEVIEDFEATRKMFWHENFSLLPWNYRNFAHKAAILSELPLQPLLDAEEFSCNSGETKALLGALTEPIKFLLGLKPKSKPISIVKAVLGMVGFGIKQVRRTTERFYSASKVLNSEHEYYNIVMEGVEKTMANILEKTAKKVEAYEDNELKELESVEIPETLLQGVVKGLETPNDKSSFSLYKKDSLSSASSSGKNRGALPAQSAPTPAPKSPGIDALIEGCLKTGLHPHSILPLVVKRYPHEEAQARLKLGLTPVAVAAPTHTPVLETSPEGGVIADMWHMVEGAIADPSPDVFGDIWDVVVTMGERYASLVRARYPMQVARAMNRS